jgi:radical SAM/Cys-rich protein
MQKIQTLHRQNTILAAADAQVKLLEETDCGILPFSKILDESENAPLSSTSIDILQINTGYVCNLLCRHCHVDAGPDRREVMTPQTMLHCLYALDNSSIKTVDITGGAPEMNPGFRWFIESIRTRVPDAKILVRSNLTLFTANGKYSDLPDFLKQQRVTLIASLPCYTSTTVDNMRGHGVFDRSIEALKLLNNLGYGKKDSNLELNLLYNPDSPSLPREQLQLEKEFKKQLVEKHGVVFNHLYTITNMPISRFLNDLLESGQYCKYMSMLAKSYNSLAVKNLMCRTTVSVGWDGTLYDCDFNQMLQLPLDKRAPQHISSFNEEKLRNRLITVGQHCYGCTAGAGSSCQGCLV